MNQLPYYFSAAKIANALGVHKKTIHRLAAKAGWNKRNNGYRNEYSPPLPILSKVWESEKNITIRNVKRRKLTVRLDDLYDDKQTEKARLREMAVQILREYVERGVPKEKALVQVSDLMKRFPQLKAGVGSLRHWKKNYKEHGIDGLVEQKLGRAGRKPKTPISTKPQKNYTAGIWTKLGTFNFTVEGLLDGDGGIKEIRVSPAPTN